MREDVKKFSPKWKTKGSRLSSTADKGNIKNAVGDDD